MENAEEYFPYPWYFSARAIILSRETELIGFRLSVTSYAKQCRFLERREHEKKTACLAVFIAPECTHSMNGRISSVEIRERGSRRRLYVRWSCLNVKLTGFNCEEAETRTCPSDPAQFRRLACGRHCLQTPRGRQLANLRVRYDSRNVVVSHAFR
jgi:hypothetical protein